MMRRPDGHVAPQRKMLLALATLLLPWGVTANALQQHTRSPPENVGHASPPDLLSAAVTGHEVLETPHVHLRRKSTDTNTISHDAYDGSGRRQHAARHNYDSAIVPDDVSAIQTLALDNAPSVRAPSSRHRGGSGLTAPLAARSLLDWEVEDFVLLATIDGHLYANDRKTGNIRWHVEVDQPMVETILHRANHTALDDDFSPVDQYIWMVEPNRDGGVYLWVPGEHNPGLVKMPYSMKQMVDELAPYDDKERNILYTGDKKTTMVTLDAATGKVIKWFGSTGTQVNDMESCLKPTSVGTFDTEECSSIGTITLGRTEYTVGIHRSDGRAIATLKYMEWGPNMFDRDLMQQHVETKDKQYITSRHDGEVIGFDYGDMNDNTREHGYSRFAFVHKLNSPVARVFDVLRRYEESSSKNLDLTVLPQPPPPAENEEIKRVRNENVFVSQTDQGSWYAMSGIRYPLVLQAPKAPIHNRDWWDMQRTWEMMDEAEVTKALVGVHPLPTAPASGSRAPTPPLLTLPDKPSDREAEEPDQVPGQPHAPAAPEPSRLLITAKKIPQLTAEKAVDFVQNPLTFMLAIVLLYYLWLGKRNGPLKFKGAWTQVGTQEKAQEHPVIIVDPPLGHTATISDGSVLQADQQPVKQHEKVESSIKQSTADQSAAVDEAELLPGPSQRQGSLKVSFADPPVTMEDIGGDPLLPEHPGTVTPIETPKKEKKAHRGRRGGVKHKKGKDRREVSQSRDDDPPQEAVDEVIQKAKKLGEVPPTIEPDIQTITNNDIDAVSGPRLRMGSLEVNTDVTLGVGSNGTVVFSGKWDGRDVAVKRMLVQFTEIASQETKLLRESDNHPNVIRYFAQQQHAAFLYIALELCQASLADVVLKAHEFPHLALAIEQNIPSVLYQVTKGLSHLHDLRIVHRDLKPQNILLNVAHDGRPCPLVSDFGLCKKLEGGQSSFGATTAHAAGTMGWRAPELLQDDDESTAVDQASSFHSGSGSILPGSDLVGANTRRVTRAIDIFSLGLVFYFVLTKGAHPFDWGDKYMREPNIRKGNHNLKPLDALGDYAFEARDLISSMLSTKAKERPAARTVMAHPFFWSAETRLEFLCNVSDYFEKEPRDPPSAALVELENLAPLVVKGDFLKHLPKDFIDSLGKQRKYTGTRLLDLLRALRNKKNHYDDMPEALRKNIGSLPDGYLGFWARRFPNLLLACHDVVRNVGWVETDRFRKYYQPAAPGL